MSSLFKFGETVEGYAIPVLNEREIRAAAGLLFLLLYSSIMIINLTEDFLLLKYSITIFLTDILIRVFISPRYSPSLIIGRFIVRNQVPEYVGAQQKRFAWIIGVVLASVIFVMSVVVNSVSPISGIGCMICLAFLFFEAAFGICLGCVFYKMFYKEEAQYCPGEVCEVKDRHPIQKTTGSQMLILLFFAVYIALLVYFFNDFFSERPWDIFGLGLLKNG